MPERELPIEEKISVATLLAKLPGATQSKFLTRDDATRARRSGTCRLINYQTQRIDLKSRDLQGASGEVARVIDSLVKIDGANAYQLEELDSIERPGRQLVSLAFDTMQCTD